MLFLESRGTKNHLESRILLFDDPRVRAVGKEAERVVRAGVDFMKPILFQIYGKF
jgi:hypothetical protein